LTQVRKRRDRLVEEVTDEAAIASFGKVEVDVDIDGGIRGPTKITGL
jgi:hypothetical protein